MQVHGGGEAAATAAGPPTKRTRRPSVRLHEPYYEFPIGGHRKPIQRHSDGPKKPSNAKKDGDDASGAGQGEDIKFDYDDDVAIGKWKDFNVSKRNRAFKRKRFGPSGSKKSSSGKQQEEEEEDGINSNLVVDDSDPSSPLNHRSVASDDGNDKLSDSNNNNDNVDRRNQQRGLKKRDRCGVGAWLKELGLDKYAPMFEVHEVDDEVLGQLTLEDLKDMGINAVGSRRKMYASIQKLSQGLS